MGAAEQEADARVPMKSVLENVSAKLSSEDLAVKRLRPKPLELQVEMSAEERQELATERYLLDGFFKAKLQNADQEFDLTDVQMLRNLQAVCKHLVYRSKNR